MTSATDTGGRAGAALAYRPPLGSLALIAASEG